MSVEWNYNSPSSSMIADNEVNLEGTHLSKKNIALLISGSIAAYRAPDLIRDLRREGASVNVYITEGGLRYVSKDVLEWCSQNRVIDNFSSEAEHLNDLNPFDAFLVAISSLSVDTYTLDTYLHLRAALIGYAINGRLLSNLINL